MFFLNEQIAGFLTVRASFLPHYFAPKCSDRTWRAVLLKQQWYKFLPSAASTDRNVLQPVISSV